MGLCSTIKVLTDAQMGQIHEKVLYLLSRKGILFQSDMAARVFREQGARVDGQTVYIERDMVEKALRQCPETFLLEALNPAKNITIGEGLLVHPANGEATIADRFGKCRYPNAKDFADMQKVYQACDNVNMTGFQPLTPVDVPAQMRGLFCTLTSLRHTDKPVLTPIAVDTVKEKEQNLRLFDIAFGQDGYTDRHYLTWHAICSNSPFCYTAFACEGLEFYAAHNQPIILVSSPMTGISSPYYLYSTVIMSLAELLAGLVYAQLLRPGIPVVPSASLSYGNLMLATYECAAPDTALLQGAVVQMLNDYYHLPSRAHTGITSSKLVDYQAGMETIQSFLFAALAGVNLTSQSVGTLNNLVTCSLEKTVLDDEMIGRCHTILAGMDTSEEAMGMDDLLEAEPLSDFLMSDSTIEHMRDSWNPELSDWRTYEAWEADGMQDVAEVAHRRVNEILAAAPETLLTPEQERDLTRYVKGIEESF
jgi:trimethylamine--corrinoid protein Co-methyltransferase